MIEAANDGELNNLQAVMVMEDWQPDLKKITMRIVWDDPQTNKAKTFEKHLFLHRDHGEE